MPTRREITRMLRRVEVFGVFRECGSVRWIVRAMLIRLSRRVMIPERTGDFSLVVAWMDAWMHISFNCCLLLIFLLPYLMSYDLHLTTFFVI